jgi:hypothetical protein
MKTVPATLRAELATMFRSIIVHMIKSEENIFSLSATGTAATVMIQDFLADFSAISRVCRIYPTPETGNTLTLILLATTRLVFSRIEKVPGFVNFAFGADSTVLINEGGKHRTVPRHTYSIRHSEVRHNRHFRIKDITPRFGISAP